MAKFFKIGFFLFFCFLFFSLVSVFSSAVLQSESAILDVSLDLPVEFDIGPGGSFVSLNINFISTPFNSSRQRVLSQEYSLDPVNVSGGIASFVVYEPDDFVLSSNFRVETSAEYSFIDRKVRFPLSNIDSSYYDYISPSDVYDINSDIEALAVSLAGEDDDLFVVVSSLADWVHRNVEYDLDVVDGSQLPASWVFDNRVGVCTEYTSLFIALARSLGIPSREVSGFAFTESDLFPSGWEFHSWAEVYFPGFGWVPFDPTYGQFGFVDAGHVQVGPSVEDGVLSNSFSWRGRDVNVIPGSTDLSVDVISRSGSRNISSFEVDWFLLEDVVGFGSYNFLRVDLFNENSYYVAETIRFADVNGLSFLSDLSSSVVVPPNSDRSVYFVFKVDESLDGGFVYTFPLTFFLNEERFSTTLQAIDDSVFVSEDVVSPYVVDSFSRVESFSCFADEFVSLNENFTISCSSLNVSGELCFRNFCKDFDERSSLELSVFLDEPGIFTDVVSFTSDDSYYVSYLNFMVVDAPSLSLEESSISSVVSPSDIVVINASLIKQSSSIPSNVSLSFNHDYFSETFFIGDVDSAFLFEYSIPANNLKKGINEITVKAKFQDVFGEVFEESIMLNVSVEGLSLLNEVEFFFNRVYFWFKNLW